MSMYRFASVITIFIVIIAWMDFSSASTGFSFYGSVSEEESVAEETVAIEEADPFTLSARELRSQNYDKARSILRQIIRTDREPQIRMKAMWQLYNVNNQVIDDLERESMEMLQALAAEFPDSEFAAVSLHNSARLNADSGDKRVAKANFRRLIDNYPHYRRRSDAIADYAKFLLKTDVNNPEIGETIELFLRNSPGHSWEKPGMLALGRWLEQIGEYDRANVIYQRIIRNWPDSPEAEEAVAAAGGLIARIEDIDTRLQYLKSNLDDPESALQAAVLLERQGKPESAAQVLEEAIRLNRDSSAFEAALGRNLELSGRYDDARDIYEKIISNSSVRDRSRIRQAAWRLSRIYAENKNRYIFQGPGQVFLRDTSNLDKALEYLAMIHESPQGRNDQLAHDALLEAARITSKQLFDNHRATPLYRRLLREFPNSPARNEARSYLNM